MANARIDGVHGCPRVDADRPGLPNLPAGAQSTVQEVRAAITNVCSELLEQRPEHLTIDANLRQMGLSSFRAAQLRRRLEAGPRRVWVRLPKDLRTSCRLPFGSTRTSKRRALGSTKYSVGRTHGVLVGQNQPLFRAPVKLCLVKVEPSRRPQLLLALLVPEIPFP